MSFGDGWIATAMASAETGHDGGPPSASRFHALASEAAVPSKSITASGGAAAGGPQT